jgi:hypothetical protein
MAAPAPDYRATVQAQWDANLRQNAQAIATAQAAVATPPPARPAVQQRAPAAEASPIPTAAATSSTPPAPAHAPSGVASLGGVTAAWLLLAALTAWGLRWVQERRPGGLVGAGWGCWFLVLVLPLAVSVWTTAAFIVRAAPGGGLLLLLLAGGGAARWGYRRWAARGDVGRPRDWLVPDFIPCGPHGKRLGYITIVGGAGGTGKSFLLLDLLVAALAGQPWMGMLVRRLTSVVFVDLEMDADEFWARVAAVCAGRGVPLVAIRGMIHYLPLKAYGEDLHVPSPQERAKGERAAGQERVRAVIARHRAQLALVDSLSYGGGTEPGDQAGWKRVLLPPHGLESWGCPVLTIDHVTVRNGRVEKLAGGQNKLWIARSIFLLEPAGAGALKVTHAKASFGRQQEPFLLQRAFVADPATGVLEAVRFTRPDVEAGSTGRGAVLWSASTKGVARPGTVPEGIAAALAPAPVALRPRLVVVPPLPAEDGKSVAVRPKGGEVPQGNASPSAFPTGEVGAGERSPGEHPVTVGDAAGALGGRRGHALIDAKVLAAVRGGADAGDRIALAEATGYAPKTISNSLSRLRKAELLPRPVGRAVAVLEGAEGASA